MKKYLSKIIAATFIVTALSFSTTAQVYVTIRPVPPRIVRPVAPSPRHIWIDGEWVWRTNRYEYVNGYWVVPGPKVKWVPGYWEQRGHAYGHRKHKKGHWKNKPGGWYWVPGRWR